MRRRRFCINVLKSLTFYMDGAVLGTRSKEDVMKCFVTIRNILIEERNGDYEDN